MAAAVWKWHRGSGVGVDEVARPATALLAPVGVRRQVRWASILELDEARRLLAWGCQELTATGDAAHLSTMAALNTHALLHAGDLDEARAQVSVALASGSADDMSTSALAAAAQSWLAALDGDLAASRRHAAESVRLAETTDQLEGQALVHLACAEAASLAGDRSAARRHREAAIERFAAKGNVVAVARQRVLL